MNKLKFLHCSDLHLDMPFASLGNDKNRSTQRRQDLKDVLYDIIQIAKNEKVHILIICGDLYEHNYIRRSTINHVNELFKSIPQTKIVMIPGNHDPYAVNSYYANYSWADNVFILSSQNSFFYFEELSACVWGMGFLNSNRAELTIPEFNLDESLFNIMLLHGTVDMNFGKTVLNPVSSIALAATKMDYVALGHFHNRLEDLGNYGRIFNPGSPEPLGFDEENEHGVFLCALDRTNHSDSSKQLHYEFIRTNKKTYYNLGLDITGLNTDEQIILKISGLLKGMHEESLVSITLKGFIENSFSINATHIEECFNDKIFFLKLCDNTSPFYDIEEIVEELGLRGLFVRKMLDKIESEEDMLLKDKLRRSLYFGLKALEKGEIDL
ncbi:MAG: DNA repair exonuclease [Bacillota bacterium]|nr:DNA repair exonuclease [Bacillota bacterium]